MKFKLQAKFIPSGDQPKAIKQLVANLTKGVKNQVLLGVTGSGKTFTMANVIEKIQKPTLVIAHNKTLAAQLYSEFKQFFPQNAVHYFVSYYDYYQPEAYIPYSDTYIEKETNINEEIDKLRCAATAALLSRKDVIIVASVSCIYGLGNPLDYSRASLHLSINKRYSRKELLERLIDMRYERNDIDFWRGKVRVRGEAVDIFPAYEDFIYRLTFFEDKLEKIYKIDYFTGEIFEMLNEAEIFPAKHFVTSTKKMSNAFEAIRAEMKEQVKKFKKEGKFLEAQRIEERTNFDIEMMEQTGYCNGIENYSRHLDGRLPGQPPACLIDYFPEDFLLFVDESHITIPQIQGMYRGDRARKETLIEYGFRLPSALDNRPLTFEEFEAKLNQTIFVSATPASYEIEKSQNIIVEQIVRPTGLLDPEVEVRPTKNQIKNLIDEIKKRVKKGQRTLVTALTKRLAEDLAQYLTDLGIKTHYLHSEIDTLERMQILRSLRLGKYDVLVGINLLREGLDLPEVSLVAIFDADKEGFLRSETSLIQTFGRAARHAEGKVIMYADKLTDSMRRAIKETERRRQIQQIFNKKYKVKPQTIVKDIDEIFAKATTEKKIESFNLAQISQEELSHLIKELTNQMNLAAQNLEFEKAALLRDQIKLLEGKSKKARKRV